MAEADEETGKSIHETAPAFVSNVSAPSSAFVNVDNPVAANPPTKVEVAVVEVAVKLLDTVSPCTVSLA